MYSACVWFSRFNAPRIQVPWRPTEHKKSLKLPTLKCTAFVFRKWRAGRGTIQHPNIIAALGTSCCYKNSRVESSFQYQGERPAARACSPFSIVRVFHLQKRRLHKFKLFANPGKVGLDCCFFQFLPSWKKTWVHFWCNSSRRDARREVHTWRGERVFCRKGKARSRPWTATFAARTTTGLQTFTSQGAGRVVPIDARQDPLKLAHIPSISTCS
jgi:hypothetical protein